MLALVDDARRTSGSTTRLIVSGRPAALDPGVELAAYRIVQEALTNARRHAPGAPVDVELRFAPDALHLRIVDSGPGATAAAESQSPTAGASGNGDSHGHGHGHGHGLSGMHERAASVGGHLTTGSSPVGGFLVEARLPADPVASPAIADRSAS